VKFTMSSLVSHLLDVSNFISYRMIFVLYMSMRIRSEGLTREEFANEIGSSGHGAEAVELNSGMKYKAANMNDSDFV
jgi:hypothetical protein